MRLVTFSIATPLGEVSRVGALFEDQVVDLAAACGWQLIGAAYMPRPRWQRP